MLSSSQIKAARALLGWSGTDLADKKRGGDNALSVVMRLQEEFLLQTRAY